MCNGYLKSQQILSSTQKQFNDSSYDMNTSVGLGYGDVIIFPSFQVSQKVLKGTVSILPDAVRRSSGAYDDTVFNILNKTNNIAPNLTNEFIKNNKKVNEFFVDAITDYNLLGIPSPSKIGYGIGGYGLISDYFEKNKEKNK